MREWDGISFLFLLHRLFTANSFDIIDEDAFLGLPHLEYLWVFAVSIFFLLNIYIIPFINRIVPTVTLKFIIQIYQKTLPHSQIYWKQQDCINIPICFPEPQSPDTSVSIFFCDGHVRNVHLLYILLPTPPFFPYKATSFSGSDSFQLGLCILFTVNHLHGHILFFSELAGYSGYPKNCALLFLFTHCVTFSHCQKCEAGRSAARDAQGYRLKGRSWCS